MLIAHLLLALQESAVTIPERPAPGSYVVDEANLLTPRSIAEINASVAASDKRGRPVYVVTIASLAAHGAEEISVADYARRVFDGWRIGGGVESRGALLLVSAHERAAQIELGRAWNHDRDVQMRRIMAEDVLPAMRRAEPTQGIVNAAAGISNEIAPWSSRVVLIGAALILTAGGWMVRRSFGITRRPPIRVPNDYDPDYNHGWGGDRRRHGLLDDLASGGGGSSGGGASSDGSSGGGSSSGGGGATGSW